MTCDVRQMNSDEIFPTMVLAEANMKSADIHCDEDGEWFYRGEVDGNRLEFHGRKLFSGDKKRIIDYLYLELYIKGTRIRFDATVSHKEGKHPQDPEDVAAFDIDRILDIASRILIKQGHAGVKSIAKFIKITNKDCPKEDIAVKLERIPKLIRRLYRAM